MLCRRLSLAWRRIHKETYSFSLQVQYFVNTYKGHPFLFPRLDGMNSKCSCKGLVPFETCDLCVQMRYLLNLRCYKSYMAKILVWIQNVLVPLDSYVEHDTLKCEKLFHFKNNKVYGSLDNPLLNAMKGLKNLSNWFFFTCKKLLVYFFVNVR